jgi:hypothetical protein
MILSYRDKRTEAFSKGEFVRDFQGFVAQANKRLEIQQALKIYALCRATAWKLCAATGLGNIAFALTSNGACVLNGHKVPMAHQI